MTHMNVISSDSFNIINVYLDILQFILQSKHTIVFVYIHSKFQAKLKPCRVNHIQTSLMGSIIKAQMNYMSCLDKNQDIITVSLT